MPPRSIKGQSILFALLPQDGTKKTKLSEKKLASLKKIGTSGY
jgi:hypothetical protein